MLNLKGLTPNIDTQEFEYNLPEHWGPGKVECFIKITAAPAAAKRAAYLADVEKCLRDAAVADCLRMKNYKLRNDDGEMVDTAEVDAKKVVKRMAEIQYKHCIRKWETNIIDADTGKVLPNDEETFLELAKIPHKDVANIFNKFSLSLNDISNWQSDVETEVELDEVKKSNPS